MRVSLNSTYYDLEGSLVVEALPDSDWGETARRISRVATLDGGVAVNDYGSAAGDRTITLAWALDSAADEEAAAWIVETHQMLTLSCHLGLLLVAPESLKCADGRAVLKLLVLEKLSGA